MATSSKKNKKKDRPWHGGRPKGRILDKAYNQQRMLRRIVATGTERHCYKGIVTSRSYETWRKDPINADWPARVERAIKQHHNHKALADPDFRELVITILMNRVRARDITNKELLQLLQYLPEHCEVVLHEN